jgi:hypothetical protein
MGWGGEVDGWYSLYQLPAGYDIVDTLIYNVSPDVVVEPVIISVIVTDSSAGEPSDNGSYRITRTGSTSSSLTVYFSMSGSTSQGSDYIIGNSVTIAAGELYADITLEVIDDGRA